MRFWAALALLAVGISARPIWAESGALAQLEGASAAASGTLWSDGGRLGLAPVDVQEDPWAAPGPTLKPFEKAPGGGWQGGLETGFTTVEYPAYALDRVETPDHIHYLGPVSLAVFVVLLIPALIAGGVCALIEALS